jgi:hypothetical protein
MSCHSAVSWLFMPHQNGSALQHWVQNSVSEPEPHLLAGAGVVTRCGTGSGSSSDGSGSDNGNKHG